MLASLPNFSRPAVISAYPSRQRGVTLMIALVILVVMTIGGLTLVRSIDTTNLVAGNLAFQQAALRSGEAGIEDAVRNVIERPGAATNSSLWNNDFTRGYAASIECATPFTGNCDFPAGFTDPANPTNRNWDAYWRVLNPNPVASPVAPRSCVERVCTMPTDASGNRVSYHIQRLCRVQGDPKQLPTGCPSAERKSPLSGNPLDPDAPSYLKLEQYYYRITVRVTGPRNTVSYLQAIVTK